MATAIKMGLFKEHINKLEEITGYIHNNIHEQISIPLLSEKFGIGKSTLRRHFSHHYNLSIHGYILNVRMIKAMELVMKHEVHINQIGIMVGYKDLSSFTRAFSKFYKNPPLFYSRSINHN